MEVNRRAGFRAFKVVTLVKEPFYITHFEILVLFTVSLVNSENRHTQQAKQSNCLSNLDDLELEIFKLLSRNVSSTLRKYQFYGHFHSNQAVFGTKPLWLVNLKEGKSQVSCSHIDVVSFCRILLEILFPCCSLLFLGLIYRA